MPKAGSVFRPSVPPRDDVVDVPDYSDSLRVGVIGLAPMACTFICICIGAGHPIPHDLLAGLDELTELGDRCEWRSIVHVGFPEHAGSPTSSGRGVIRNNDSKSFFARKD
jgi:hypothetical protein